MASRLHSWWQKSRYYLIVVGVIGIVLLVAFTLAVWRFGWDWTGFGPYTPSTKNSSFQRGKTLWDWLQLLIVPIMLAIGGGWLNQIQKHREEKTSRWRTVAERFIADDNQQEVALQAYIDKVSELLLERHLRELKPEYEEVRKIARVRTLMVLPKLSDKRRRGSALQFLYESGLIDKNEPIIGVRGTDISEAELSGINLKGANLEGANLRGADLRGANLEGANLRGADLSMVDTAEFSEELAEEIAMSTDEIIAKKALGTNIRLQASFRASDLGRFSTRGANLEGANLRSADLKGANLEGANLRSADLREANLEGANLRGADLREAGPFLGIKGVSFVDFEASIETAESTPRGADLKGANLKGANLSRATATCEQLKRAESLEGVTMPDGSIHP